MEIVRVKLTELKPYGKNPRKNDEAAKAVAKSIKLEKEYIRNKQRAAEERRWVNGKTKERNRPRAV